MNRLIVILCLTCVLSAGVFAQNDTDEYKKNEFYVGYTNQQSDNFRGRTSNGAEGAYIRNVSRYFGLKADFSAVFNRNTTTGTFFDPSGSPTTFSFRNRNSRYNFLGGIQIKDNASTARFKPFVHALAGVAVTRTKFETLSCTTTTCPTGSFVTGTFQTTNFSAAVGGGLDIRINKRLDFRAFQIDYNPIFGSGSRQNNVRIGVGFVIR